MLSTKHSSTHNDVDSIAAPNVLSFHDQPVVCVIGLGYIGLPTAAVLADHGMRVHGVEVNATARAIINSGRAHVIEPDLDAVVARGIESGRLEAFESAGPADVFILCVPTPVGEESGADLSYVRSATLAISKYLQPGNLVILESTSPPGTTESIACIVTAETGLTTDQIHFAHAPERVLPGHILREVIFNDRVIGGIDEASTEAAANFYRRFVKGDILKCHCRVAETVKLVENASRDSQIAFANELSMFCDAIGTDVRQVIELANRHPRVNILQPGCGVGGHCIAVDPWFLIHQAEKEFALQVPMIRTARETNLAKTRWVIDKIKSTMQDIKGAKLACFGAAYKPNIDDLRGSPAIEIIEQLTHAFGDYVLCVEPHVSEIAGIHLVSMEYALEKADLIVFLVAHRQFDKVFHVDLTEKTILDFTGTFDLQRQFP